MKTHRMLPLPLLRGRSWRIMSKTNTMHSLRKVLQTPRLNPWQIRIRLGRARHYRCFLLRRSKGLLGSGFSVSLPESHLGFAGRTSTPYVPLRLFLARGRCPSPCWLSGLSQKERVFHRHLNGLVHRFPLALRRVASFRPVEIAIVSCL